MGLVLRTSFVFLLTVSWLGFAIVVAADNSIVIRPEDFAQIDVKGRVVEVLIKGPKAKRLAAEQRHTTIEFNVPFAHEKDVLISETRFGINSATMTFRFPTPASAADFA